MDGDGLILYLSLLVLTFGLGTIFGTCLVKYENKKPAVDEQAIIKEVKRRILHMSVPQFAEWIKT